MAVFIHYVEELVLYSSTNSNQNEQQQNWVSTNNLPKEHLHYVKYQLGWISFDHQPILPTDNSKLFSFVSRHFYDKPFIGRPNPRSFINTPP